MDMLNWIVVILITMATAFVFYSRRYTGTKRIWGLYSVQFFSLFVGAPVILISIINIALEIMSRPELQHVPTSTNVLFSLLSISIIATAIGNGIHSTSTSVSEAFPKGSRTKAYFTNEIFHDYMSHEMGNLGAIGIAIFIGLLELNHPAQNPPFSLELAVAMGLVIGLLAASYIIRGTYIGLSLLASFWGSLIMIFEMYSLYGSQHLYRYPLSTAMLTFVFTVFTTLILVAVVVLLSKNLTRKLVRLLFPKGHPVRETFHI